MSTLIVSLGEREKMEGRRAKVSGLKVGTGLHLLMLRGSGPCMCSWWERAAGDAGQRKGA